MGLTDSIYKSVTEIISSYEETSEISFDSLYEAIHREINNKAITYSWDYSCILNYIKQHTNKAPTKDCIYTVVREIKRNFSIRNPVTTEHIINLIKDLHERNQLSFVEEKLITIKNNRILITLGIPKFIPFIELQTELYDISEREGLEIKMLKDFSNPNEHKIIFDVSGETKGLMKIKKIFKTQIKLGSRIIKEKEIAKKEINE